MAHKAVARIHNLIYNLRNDQGQSLVEYGLILTIVSLGAIVALGYLSGKLNGLFSKAGNQLAPVVTPAP